MIFPFHQKRAQHWFTHIFYSSFECPYFDTIQKVWEIDDDPCWAAPRKHTSKYIVRIYDPGELQTTPPWTASSNGDPSLTAAETNSLIRSRRLASTSFNKCLCALLARNQATLPSAIGGVQLRLRDQTTDLVELRRSTGILHNPLMDFCDCAGYICPCTTPCQRSQSSQLSRPAPPSTTQRPCAVVKTDCLSV